MQSLTRSQAKCSRLQHSKPAVATSTSISAFRRSAPASCSTSHCSWVPTVAYSNIKNRQPTHTKAGASVQSPTAEEVINDLDVSKRATDILNYALNFSRVSETYEVHSWMLLLGILKYEDSNAAKSLVSLGLDDLYGAWHEVLWALNVSDGLEATPYVPELRFADCAFKVMRGAVNFAEWAGRKKVQSEDILMALAAANVLQGLFPDLSLSFNSVRAAIEKQTGARYVLPDDKDEPRPNPEDNFL